jgi:hypothetical protein
VQAYEIAMLVVNVRVFVCVSTFKFLKHVLRDCMQIMLEEKPSDS